MAIVVNESIADKDPLSVNDISKELDTGRMNVYRLIESGALKAARINKRGDFRIYRSWLRDFCETGGVQLEKKVCA
jgi:excisionase family DNA binding protein